MKFLMVSHAKHYEHNGKMYAYGPLVREMNLWSKYVDELMLLVPFEKSEEVDAIHEAYQHQNISIVAVPTLDFTSAGKALASLPKMLVVLYRLFGAMRLATHIHLRCPGNIALLGCLVQLFFPNKTKTAKYAGNWDPKSEQPLSYRLQKNILSNTALSKNMRVLVYGEWPQQTSNIVPFFTATYKEEEKEAVVPLYLQEPIRFCFVGALAPGKQPLLALQLVQRLKEKGRDVRIDFFGEGKERTALTQYIESQDLKEVATLHGNQDKETVKQHLQHAHFLILLSKSEGWPKVVAEAMFWGAVPIASSVSCVPFMLGEGARGVLAHGTFEDLVGQVEEVLNSPETFENKRKTAIEWSRSYTLDRFEAAIKKLLSV